MAQKNSGYVLVRAKEAKAKRALMAFMEEQGLQAGEWSTEEAEDMGLLLSMLEADRTRKVSRDSIMRKLSR